MDKTQYQHLWEEAEEIIAVKDREIAAFEDEKQRVLISFDVLRELGRKELAARDAEIALLRANRDDWKDAHLRSHGKAVERSAEIARLHAVLKEARAWIFAPSVAPSKSEILALIDNARIESSLNVAKIGIGDDEGFIVGVNCGSDPEDDKS